MSQSRHCESKKEREGRVMVVYLSAKATSCACLEHALHKAHLCYDESKHTASVVMNANTRPSEDESETILQYSGLAAGTKSNNKRNNRICSVEP